MTLLNVTRSVFPIIQVESRWRFAVKILAVILGANLIGALILLIAARKKARRTAAAALVQAD